MVELFSGCSGLTELSVSSFDTSNVTEMDRMFDGCLSLKTLDLSSFDTSKITSMDRLFADCSSLETVDISSFHTENVTSMQYMLSGTNASVFDLSVLDMTRVTDASGMFSAAQQTSIDASVLDFSNVEYTQELFSNNKKLEAVVFPKNMSIIGDRTFLECMNLKSMEIPDGMKSIGSLAFGSSGLETIVIPVSVNKIAEKAFSNSKLKDVYFKGNQSQWEAIDIGADNPELLNATIHFEPNGTWDTGASWRLKEGVLTISGEGTVPQDAFPESLIAFEIQSVIIEEGITEIGANAFAGCKHIAYVFFPLGLAKIGEGAFGACTALSTVKYAGTEEEWSKIAIGSDNDPLYAAEIEYEADEAVPEMKIELTAKPVRNVKANDAIAYTITVKNSGHVSISGIVLQDSLGALTDEPFDLAPGGTRAVTYGYIVTQADMDTGSFANTATASGSSTGGDSDITVTSEEVIIRAEKAYSELFVTLSAEPDEHVMPGEPIAYLLFVENTGNVTLTDIGLTDSLKALEIEPFSLAPRQARSIEFTYMPESAEICAGTIENTVTVNAASVRGDNPEEVSETVRVATAGHIFDETVYTWEQNYSALTASHVCVNDGYTETETVGATSTILSPTEDTEGSFSCSSEDFTNEAFKAQTKLVTIPALGDMNVLTLPAGTRRIEKEAFAGTAFEAVLVPNACTYIGESAFGGCANLIYIHVPSAAEMDPDAFSGSENVIVDTSPVDDGT